MVVGFVSDPQVSLGGMSSMMSPGMHPVLAALRVIDNGLDELAEGNLWSLLDGESLEVRAELERLSSRLYAAKLRSTREVEVRGSAIKAGATSTRAWLINRVRLHPGEASRELLLAARVADHLPVTAAALAAGEITPAAAAVIADTDQALARLATAAQRGEAEETLAGHARTLPVRGLSNVALHLTNLLDPDHGDRLVKDEEEQIARREFWLRPNPDGSSRPGGYLDKEATAFLRAALDPLAKPRPAADGVPDPRTAAQRTGDALLELVELALRSGDLPTQNGQPVQLVVTIDYDNLRLQAGDPHDPGRPGHPHRPGGASAGLGVLDTGVPVSAETVRRWACDCQIIPMVLGTAAEPLDVGRAARTPPPPLRRALDARDGGCAFPGCDRPPKWSRAHHIWHWTRGGPTSIGNLVLLCDHHHKAVHHHGWDVHIDTDGLPTFYPPVWVDPDRTPRRHHRFTPRAGSPDRNRHGPQAGQPEEANPTVLTFPQRN